MLLSRLRDRQALGLHLKCPRERGLLVVAARMGRRGVLAYYAAEEMVASAMSG
jgi:hypothetical protein